MTSSAVVDSEESTPESVAIDDCLYFDPAPTEKQANWYSGVVSSEFMLTVTVVPSGMLIDTRFLDNVSGMPPVVGSGSGSVRIHSLP